MLSSHLFNTHKFNQTRTYRLLYDPNSITWPIVSAQIVKVEYLFMMLNSKRNDRNYSLPVFLRED